MKMAVLKWAIPVTVVFWDILTNPLVMAQNTVVTEMVHQKGNINGPFS